MNTPVIRDVERIWVSVPLKPRHARHLTRENWDWTVFEIIRLTSDTDLVGWGETMCYYTWGRVPQEQIERVKGRSPFEFLGDDRLGAGLQMAAYDLAAKALGLPVYRLLGPKVRDFCPISWWTNDMSTDDWLEEMREALSLGYMGAKLKARPWRDFRAQIEALARIVPSDFRFDADYNSFLRDSAHAVPYLLELEKIPAVAFHETPIPQGDVEGNAAIRRKVSRPIAMHYGTPPIQTVVRDEVCDGFVVGGGAGRILRDASVCAELSKPFWLQMVGTGITTAFALHLGSGLANATWPAITCHEIYEDDLLTGGIPVAGGYSAVPEAPGLGVEIDEAAIARYRVDEGFRPPAPDALYRVRWPSGGEVVYRVGKEGVWDDFAAGNQFLFHEGVELEVVANDESREWRELHARCERGPVRLER